MSKQEKGRWITIEGRHIFIKDGQSIDDAVKIAWGQKHEDAEDRKERQIANNKKEADERNRGDYVIVHPHPSKKESKTEIKPGKLSKEDLQKIVDKHRKDKNTPSEFKNKTSQEGFTEDGKFRLHDGTVCDPAPDGVTSNENGKYFSPDGKHWFKSPERKKPDWLDNPPAPKLDVGEKSSTSSEPDENGLYDVTKAYDSANSNVELSNELMRSKMYFSDRRERFVHALKDGGNAQNALDVLSDNAQGIFIDCPHDTTVTFTDSNGRTVEAKARVDNQWRVSWTIKVDGKRSGSGWSSRDLAGMLPSDPKDFSMHIPFSASSYSGSADQPEIKISIKDGKISKSVKTAKKGKDAIDRASERNRRFYR